MTQIAFISYQHNDNVGIRMITEFFQPSRDIVISLMLADIVDKKSSHSTSIIGGCNGSIAFLPGCVPNLCFDRLGVHLDGSGCEFDADGRFGIEVEFVAGEPA